MRIFLLCALFCIAVFNGFSQIVITGSDMPQAGKMYVVKYDSLTPISLGSASSQPQVWNFSQLQPQYFKVASYSSTAPSQYLAPIFPGANIYTYGPSYMFAGLFGGAPVDQSMWGYAFWKSDNTGLRTIGWRGDYGIGFRNVLETQPELLMGTPASYGSVFNNSSQWSVALDAVPSNYDTVYVAKVKKTLTADAFGQLTTPFGSFDVLRVHEYFIETDSSYASLNGQPLPYPGVVIRRDTLHNYYFWANGVGYPVATIHANKNNVIKNIEYLDSITNTYSIHGKVMMHNNTSPVNAGKVALVGHDAWDHLFGVDEEVPLNNTGNFQFANVTGGSWMVRAMPDTIAFAGEMPTYYGNNVLWNAASILEATRDTNITIQCLGTDSVSAYSLGSGLMSGTIFADTSHLKALVAAENINIILQKGDALYYAKHGKTNHQGNYHFKNLPNSKYRLIVEISGVMQDSTYEVQVMNNTITGLNFYYDSLKVHVMNPSNIPVVKNNSNRHITVYPNPLTDKTTIMFTETLEKEANYNLSIVDVAGKEMLKKQGKTAEKIEIDCSGLKTGIYFFSLQVNGAVATRGKLVVK